MHKILDSREEFCASLRGHLYSLALHDAKQGAVADPTHGTDDVGVLDNCSREMSADEARRLFASLPRGHFGRQLLLANPSVALYAERKLDAEGKIEVREAMFSSPDELEEFACCAATSAELRAMLYNVKELAWSWNTAARHLQKGSSLQDLEAAEWLMFNASGIARHDLLAKAFNENDLIAVSEIIEPTEENARRICRVIQSCPQSIRLHPRSLDHNKRWVSSEGIEVAGLPPKLLARGELRRLVAIGCMNGVMEHPYIRMLSDEDALASDDVAVRCAAYSWGDIARINWPALAERDGTLFFVYAMMNPRLKKDSVAWSKLRDLYVSRFDKRSDRH